MADEWGVETLPIFIKKEGGHMGTEFLSEPLWKWIVAFALFFGTASLMAFVAKEV